MNLFIDKLAQDFDVEIIESDAPMQGKNTYRTDIDGNVTMLNLQKVGLKKIRKLVPIAEHLKVLSLYDCAIEKIKEIKEFTQLEELDLCMNPILNLKGIEKLRNIKKLIISFTDIQSIEEIQHLNHLRVLDVSSCTNLLSITGIEHLKFLEELICSGGEEIESFDSICAIEPLKRLILKNNDITQMKGLEKFPNLEELDLFNNRMIKKIEELEFLNKLKTLNLNSTGVTEMEGLENLKDLEYLSLASTSIAQIKGLDTVTNLRVLDFDNYLLESETPLTKIQGVSHLDKLENLILNGHQIVKLENLPTKSLQSLNVSWNKIDQIDYDCLAIIEQPCTINLTGNPVEIIVEKIPWYITIITKKGFITGLLNDIFTLTEKRLISSNKKKINGLFFSNEKKNNGLVKTFMPTIENTALDYNNYPFLYTQQSEIKGLEAFKEKLELPFEDFEDLLFVFIIAFHIKLIPDFNNRAAFLNFSHLLFNNKYILKKNLELENYIFKNILRYHAKSEGFIEYFELKNDNILYKGKKIDILIYIDEYFELIEKNYNNLKNNLYSLNTLKKNHTLLKQIFTLFTDKANISLFIMSRDSLSIDSYTFNIIDDFIKLYHLNKNKKEFYNELIKYLDYFKLSFEPKEIMEEYSSKPRERYNHKVKWRTENQVYSYILYIFNDIDSLKELLFYVQDGKKKHRLLNIIFSHPIITENKKTYNFINKEVLALLPEGYAKDRVKQLLQMKS